MAKDEYTIPNNYSEPEIRAQLDAIQYAPTTPEVQRAPYQRIKDNENEADFKDLNKLRK